MNQERSPNTTFSHYHIVSKLGAGGMGEVWLAEDTRLKRKVALKLLPADLTADAERVRRFEQEAQAASALNHPNIITVYDIGECEAGRFIVMEVVIGRTLRSVIAEDNSLETLLTLGQQMAKALSAAHAAGITHRDIKPDNIMVREDGYVKVLDFGLARLRPSTESDSEEATLAQQTMPGTVMGTVAYMSPEQARGERVSHPSDIFALGIVLYELATGRHPFKAETLIGYLHAITLQEPAPLTNWKPELPVALNALILRMLSKDVNQRPTASEIAQALQGIERRSEAPKSSSSEGETIMLPAAQVSTPRADEGFWVAVLPFKWRGANAELEDLAAGLSEDLVTGLSRFSYLRVIARSSTLRFTSETSDVRAIGRELGARYVMEGSLRQAGSQLRVAVQLVDASTGAHLWTETYSRSFSPEVIFELQDDLVPRIVSTVADWYGALPHSMSEAVRLKAPDQLSPYEAVLRGFGYFERIAPEEHAAVRAGLERAVAQAPGNADSWALLSMIYGEEHRFGFNMQPDPLGRSVQAARRAVDAGHANHFAWLALAQALFFRKEFAAFREAAERAIALNPMDGSTLEYLAHLLAFAGDWERGCALAEQARQLNPNHPGWYWAVQFLNAYRSGNYHNAHQYQLKNMMRGGGAQAFNQALHAANCGQLGEQEAAAQALRNALSLQPDLAQTLRDEFAKWYLPELVEQLMDGLRKAGLAIADSAQAASVQPVTVASEADAPPLATSSPQLITAPTQSIAVLPFANISADEENEYFCDGLAEELLNALSKIDELKVAARTSAFSFKGKNAEAREIGKTLNVNTVLEGSVRKAGHRLRINVQLVNAADGYQLWSERYDREMKDIFDVQDEITLAVVDALKVKLLGEKKAAVLKRYTDNTEAYQLYLLGRFHYAKFTGEGWRKAIEYYRQAIAKEPDYAPAFAGIAYVYVILWVQGYVPSDEAVPQIKAAVTKALALDQTLAESHLSLAMMKLWYEWDWTGAEQEFKQALALNPNNAEVHRGYGLLLAFRERRAEAMAEASRVLELDPLSLMNNFIAGTIFYYVGEYDCLLAQGRKLIELEPRFYGGHFLLATAALVRREYEQAISEWETAITLNTTPVISYFVGYLYGIVGQREKAQHVLDELQKLSAQQPVPRSFLALIYAGLGEMDRAFACLEKAYEQREGNLLFLKHNAPHLPGFSDDPRLADLLRRIGLPQ